MRISDKGQPTGCINPCSQLNISLLRSLAQGQEIENCVCCVIEIEENEMDKEW
jgi:hypothetical protein